MKRRIMSLEIVCLTILIASACFSSGNTAVTMAEETKSAWTIPPTHSPYPTYTLQPEWIREITSIAIVSRTPVPTATKTDWREPTEYYTPLPTVDLAGVPDWIIQSASVAGMEPYEVVYLFNLIQRVARDRDPYPLLDFLRFPLKEVVKCPGDIIETPEEFVRRFPSLMTEAIRANILKQTIDEIFLSWRGMAMEGNTRYDIWLIPYCADQECETHYIVLITFLRYTVFWEMVGMTTTPASC
ncbi:MAG: hypothetical protein JW793_15990 [Acidobacteria bacterium]|nr:hypothetical protein [Acidobacteriota bacterium]